MKWTVPKYIGLAILAIVFASYCAGEDHSELSHDLESLPFGTSSEQCDEWLRKHDIDLKSGVVGVGGARRCSSCYYVGQRWSFKQIKILFVFDTNGLCHKGISYRQYS